MKSKGCLIAIEGIDGSGKTVQSQLLAQNLRTEGRQVEEISFPRYEESFFGELITGYLKGEYGSDPGAVGPYLASLPYACDRWEAAPKIKAWLAAGRVVICNRYVSANMGHQGAKISETQKRIEFFKWVDRLEYDVFAVPRPDVQIWLDVPVAVAVKLIEARSKLAGAGGMDIHETASHLEKARESYVQMLEVLPGWQRVDCCAEGNLLSRDRIAAIIMECVSDIWL